MLFDKLAGNGEAVKMPIYALTGLMSETYRGQITYAQMRTLLSEVGYVEADDRADLDWLKDKLVALTDTEAGIHHVDRFLRLAEVGVTGYSTEAEFAALVNGL